MPHNLTLCHGANKGKRQLGSRSKHAFHTRSDNGPPGPSSGTSPVMTGVFLAGIALGAIGALILWMALTPGTDEKEE